MSKLGEQATSGKTDSKDMKYIVFGLALRLNLSPGLFLQKR